MIFLFTTDSASTKSNELFYASVSRDLSQIWNTDKSFYRAGGSIFYPFDQTI